MNPIRLNKINKTNCDQCVLTISIHIFICLGVPIILLYRKKSKHSLSFPKCTWTQLMQLIPDWKYKHDWWLHWTANWQELLGKRVIWNNIKNKQVTMRELLGVIYNTISSAQHTNDCKFGPYGKSLFMLLPGRYMSGCWCGIVADSIGSLFYEYNEYTDATCVKHWSDCSFHSCECSNNDRTFKN